VAAQRNASFFTSTSGKRESISSRQNGTSALRPGDRRLAAPLSPRSPRRRKGRRRRRTLLRERRDGLEILTTVGGRETNSLRRRFTPRDSFLGFVPLSAWGFVPWFLCPLHTSAARRLRKTRDDTAEGGCFLSFLWCRWLLFALLFVVVVVVPGVHSLASAACDRPSSTLPRKQKLKTVWVKTSRRSLRCPEPAKQGTYFLWITPSRTGAPCLLPSV